MKMKRKIYIGSPVRGFFEHLFNFNEDKITFKKNEDSYELVSRKKMFLHKLAKSKLLTKLGFIHQVKVKNLSLEFDGVLSYNKFLKTNRPYCIYLENPYALVNYSLERPDSKITKLNIAKKFNDPNLKAIICASNACKETLTKVYSIPEKVIIDQIYPLIPDSKYTFPEIIKLKDDDYLDCLFVASRFKVKGGYEIIELYNKLMEQQLFGVRFTIVTKIDDLDQAVINNLKDKKNIRLIEFDLPFNELNNLYATHDILLNPTRMDSFSLVTLEAMKQGMAILASDLYAIPEMVTEEVNGYLLEPKFRFFNYNNLPNESVWNYREDTVLSDYIDEELVDKMYEKIKYMYFNRPIIREFQEKSYKISNVELFSSKLIFEEWTNLFNNIF